MEQIDQGEPRHGITPPPRSQLNLISYLLLVVLAVLWPLVSFYFYEGQSNLTEQVTSAMFEIYLPTIVLQLAVLVVVLIALRSEQSPLKSIGLGQLSKWTIPVALFFLIGANITLWILQSLVVASDAGHFADIMALLPESTPEKIVWVVLCAIVAVSEELTFRGYLLTRIASLTGGRLWIGVLISTLAFASGHLYQGFGGFIVIFAYGLMFTALYLGTGSLWPGIIAHFLQDAMVILLPASFR
jgi:membrane protease YdiL (CAAX protease family)